MELTTEQAELLGKWDARLVALGGVIRAAQDESALLKDKCAGIRALQDMDAEDVPRLAAKALAEDGTQELVERAAVIREADLKAEPVEVLDEPIEPAAEK